jgi:RecA-family ATPase
MQTSEPAMTTATQATAFALAALVTAATLGGVDAMARQEYRRADAVVAAAKAGPVLVTQSVLVLGHRA